MAKKGNRVQVILECTEQKESGVAGMSRYITTKNKEEHPPTVWSARSTTRSSSVSPFTVKSNS